MTPLAVAVLLAVMADPLPGAAEFVASGVADARPVGPLVGLTADGVATLAGPGGGVVRDLVALDRVGVPRPPFPRGPVLLTTAGDRIPGRLLGGDGQNLRFRPAFATDDWPVPLTAASVVWLVRPPADTPADPPDYPWLADRRKRDTLRFRNGDTLPGTLDGFAADPAGFRFKPEAGDPRAVPFAEVAALAFNPTLARWRKPKGPYARLVLRDGTRLAVTDAAVGPDGGVLRGKTLFGRPVELPVGELVSLNVIGGKAVYLSEVKPASAETVGFLGATWPWAADRSVKGRSLQLRSADGVGTFDRGLGTHPRTTLVYNLGGKYRRFEAVVGLDADTVGRSRAVIRVLVDGKEQPLPELARLGPAVPIRVNVTGANELKLVIDFGPDGDVGADVNWGDARLVE